MFCVLGFGGFFFFFPCCDTVILTDDGLINDGGIVDLVAVVAVLTKQRRCDVGLVEVSLNNCLGFDRG